MKHDEFIALYKQSRVEVDNFYSHLDRQRVCSALTSIGQVVNNLGLAFKELEPFTKGYKSSKSVFKPKEE